MADPISPVPIVIVPDPPAPQRFTVVELLERGKVKASLRAGFLARTKWKPADLVTVSDFDKQLDLALHGRL